MQYLGSRRNAALFCVGVATAVFGYRVFFDDDPGAALPYGAAACATVLAVTVVGLLVGSRVGEWLKRPGEPDAALCVGAGVCFAFAFVGVTKWIVATYSGFSFGLFPEDSFWAALSLWNALGWGLALSPAAPPDGSRPGPGGMQYLGSRRKVVAFGAGIAAGILVYRVFIDRGGGNLIPVAAALVAFVGTVVGMLGWSLIGEHLKRRRAPGAAAGFGIGICLALLFFGFLHLAVHHYFGILFSFLPDGEAIRHEIMFWLTVSVWNSLGYGLAVSPAAPHRITAAS